MIKFETCLGIGLAGAERIGILEFEDDVADWEIEEVILEWANNLIDISWKRVE